PQPGTDVEAVARDVAATQSTGTWVALPGETEALRDRHAARVLSIDGEAPAWIVRIGFPGENVDGQIPLLLATVYGEAAAAVEMRLVDLELPGAFIAGFSGPRLGIAGLRERLGVVGRPLLITMVKPALGLTPDRSAEVVRAAALGGADLIKDDELLVSVAASDPVERVRAHEQALREVFEATGHRAINFVNVTDRPDRMVETARRAVDAGASGLMVDHLTVGTAALASLAEDPSIGVPILAHFAFSAAVSGSPRTGVAPHIAIATLPRLAGADVLVCPSPYGSLRSTRDELLRAARAATSPLGSVRPAWPMPGGGLHAGLVPVHLADLGIDHAFGAGGAVHGHPMGAAAGAAAIRQAFDAAVAGRPLADAAAEHAELAAALETWPEPALEPPGRPASGVAAARPARGGAAPDGRAPSEREW
ncbi:MAG: RuBisCO large subunit C-terminal-like domain-containing protein, partial [Chloroflexi bacterium]|nr:RuBisCO large subunit C-terminal-like domain-containing protein [Chloroflexota bacterium]